MNRVFSQQEWYQRAAKVMPGGGFGNFDPALTLTRGVGSRVWDADGSEYVDLLIGSGPMLLGHGHPEVLEAVLEQVPRGMTFFANNDRGIELAEAICTAVACCEQVRFVTSGSEANMYAMRLARAITGRAKIIKFEGGYHGMSAEAQMSLAPDRAVNFPQALPDSAGIAASCAEQILVAPFNDLEAVRSLLSGHDDIAAIIVEPLQRTLPPEPGFLEGLRSLCDHSGALLIFDEIVTGFRLAYGGAQEAYGVVPDICTLGKVIGGGFPLAAIGAAAGIMDHFDRTAVTHDRWLMQLGTLSGHPVAAAAGLKTLEILRRPDAYAHLNAIGARLQEAFTAALRMMQIPHRLTGAPALFDVWFTEDLPRDYRSARHDAPAHAAHYNAILRANGILKSPAKVYPCLALSDVDIAQVASAAQQAAAGLAALRLQGL